MNKILSFVWNNYDNDDRVKKKSITLSKQNKVVVYCVPKPKQYKQAFKRINENLVVRYIKTKNMFEWLFYRLVANEHFWKKNIVKEDLMTYSNIIIDCNDPDTLYLAKHIPSTYKVGYKTIYDSHEYWKGTRRKETFFLYTIYSYIGNTIQYWREKRYVKYATKLVTVSPSIAELISKKYNKPVIVVYNFCEYRELHTTEKTPKTAVFVGSYLREGTYDLASELFEDDYKIKVIGNAKPEKEWINYLGYMPKAEYLKILDTCQIGLCFTVVNHENMKYSIPNKLSEYIQTGCVPIINEDMIDCKAIIEKYKIGLVASSKDFTYPAELLKDPKFILRNRDKCDTILISKIKKLLEDKDLFNRINLAKKELCWEVNEPKLLSYYN